MKPKNVFIATVTNAAFLASGHAMYLAHNALMPVAVWTALLAVLSGIHHRFLSRRTRAFDYVGMYFVFISAALFLAGASALLNMTLTAVAGIAFLLLFGNSRVIIGIGSAIMIGAIYWLAGPLAFLEVAAGAAIAYVFNFIGDEVHHNHHSLIHGAWHIVIAWTLANSLIHIAG